MKRATLLLLLISSNLYPSNSREDLQVEWLRSKNGKFSEKLFFERFNPKDSSSPYTLFAAEDISKDEALIIVPQSSMLTAHGTCDTVDMLLEEVEKGEESDYYPYINHLFGDESKRGKIPVSWSDAGKNILDKVIGEGVEPQNYDQQRIEEFCEDVPEDVEDVSKLEQDAFLFVVSRSRDDAMIPFYDMIYHRNGKWRNVEVTSINAGKDIKMYAHRDIKAGEQLYLSYNECDNGCQGMKYRYLTPTILGDHGFVEQYPRRFDLVEDSHLIAEIDIDATTGEKFLTWPVGQYPDMDQLNYIHGQLKRLRDLDDIVSDGVGTLDSTHERSVIVEYHRSLKEIMELAIAHREDKIQSSATTTSKRYDLLSQPKGVGVEGLNIEVCWDNPTSRDWHTNDVAVSQYQAIEFHYNEDTDNTCLQLSGWLQTCTNFRPHYHEAFVHIPAQYVSDVKRVAFLGGGDNMILHEILKYPNLELVVGMELDQQVIRSSFRNLGTLPYFDDHRVHWWFGDATKSLFALPKSYFGSFDLVLVDLQTFVADALKVTDKLTIMETAILLMKQDGGVIAKNEDFNVRTNAGFAKYTVDLEYHDVPHICQQSITMGSNSIDFVKASPKNHYIETKAVELAGSDDSDPYHAWYSYRQTVRDTCKNNDMNYDSSSKTIDQRGVLVILEAENIRSSLESIKKVQSVINAAVKEAGFTEITISAGNEDNIFFLIMKEGYITVRLFAHEKYIAFDVLLWDTLDRIDHLNEVLLRAVGCDYETSSSSFRFVTGGMYGLETSQTDLLTQIAIDTEKLLCQDIISDVAVEDTESLNQGDSTNIVHELVSSLIPRHKNKSASILGIFCGDKNTECPILNITKKLDSTMVKVVPIYACDSLEDMHACEIETEVRLKAAVKQHKKLDGLIMDNTLPFVMGQIIESIFSNKVTHYKILESSHIILTPVVQEENWREILIDRFRTDVVLFSPAHRANLRFYESQKGKKESWVLFSAGDPAFFNHLSSALSIIKENTNIDSEIDEIANGIVNYIVDFAPPKVFTDSEYDKTRSKAQWSAQRPMGHQTIFQMNIQPPKTRLAEGELVLAEHEPGPWDIVYGGAVIQKYLGDEMYSVLYDGDKMPEDINRDQIRKFSSVDKDMSTAFEVGDLIFYKNNRGMHQNGVITRAEDDGTYSIYLLNTSGTKLYNIQRNRLMYQFESANFYQDIPSLSSPTLHAAFEGALKTKVVRNNEDILPIKSNPIGMGVLMTSFWNGGHAILKWDGLKRVDINFFTYIEDKRIRISFQSAFIEQIDYMVSVARDEQPRGYGGIVNFESEIKNPPHWV